MFAEQAFQQCPRWVCGTQQPEHDALGNSANLLSGLLQYEVVVEPKPCVVYRSPTDELAVEHRAYAVKMIYESPLGLACRHHAVPILWQNDRVIATDVVEDVLVDEEWGSPFFNKFCGALGEARFAKPRQIHQNYSGTGVFAFIKIGIPLRVCVDPMSY